MHSGHLPSATRSRNPFGEARRLMMALAVVSIGLAGCASQTTRAPVTDLTKGPQAEQPKPAASTYVVKPGDTLYKVARETNMDVVRLSQLNNITDPSQLRVGQVLRLDSTTPLPDPAPAVATPVLPVPPTTPATSAPVARASDAGVINWGWPSDGKIIQGFNSSTKGIDLEGATGDPVHAAADGKVMYAGNGVRGLGNLILLGHSDGFITAYAHNQELLVETGQEVKKGAKIATVGQSDTSSPRLHFEVRRRGTPVDPLSYLPAR